MTVADRILDFDIMGKPEARFLVDTYYQMQDRRLRSQNQVRALEADDEPHAFISWLLSQQQDTEKQIKKWLDGYSRANELSRWARSICGIGPVISAGLLAHVDVTVPTAGHIWRFAGLDPSVNWEKKQKRPWNARLKVICWHLGESFVKTKGNAKSFYGPLYDQRRAYEEARNDRGENAVAAEAGLTRVGKTTTAHKAYAAGKLPAGQLHARAKRWAVKLFLSHYHEVGYELETGEKPPKPWSLENGHVHKIEPPPS